LLESEITLAVLLILAVVLVFQKNIAGAALLGGLFVSVVLFRTLPQMKSLKAFGVEAQWFRDVKEKIEARNAGVAEVRTDLQHLTERTKVLEQRDLPIGPDLQQLNSIASSANEKLTIVESANTALDALLSKGPLSWVEDGGTITIVKMGGPTGLIKVGDDPNGKRS